MDTSILYEQLVWAFKPEINDGLSAEAQKDMVRIHAILLEALEDAEDTGYEDGRCDFQTGQDIIMDQGALNKDLAIARKGNAFLKALAEDGESKYGIGMPNAAAMMKLIRDHVSQTLANDMLYDLLAQSYDSDRAFILLKDCGNHNGGFISCIKMIRHYTGWGLKDAKDIADAVRSGTPQHISYNATFKKSEVLTDFRRIGAIVD